MRITGITTGYLASFGSISIDLYGTRAKFHVSDNSLPLPGNGIIALEFFRKEKAEISFDHNTVVLSSDPIKPIPFLTLPHLEDVPESTVPIVNVSQVQLLRQPSAATDKHVLRARTRRLFPSVLLRNYTDDVVVYAATLDEHDRRYSDFSSDFQKLDSDYNRKNLPSWLKK